MKHDFIDKYSNRNSIIHRLDPRMKLILCFCWLILVTATPNLKLFFVYLGLVTVLMAVSRVPWHFYLKKLLLVTPVVVVLAIFIYMSFLIEHQLPFSFRALSRYQPVLDTLAAMAAKIYLSILIITLLISCTRFNDLLWGLRKFRMPTVVTTLSRLVYTYLFVFVDELHRTMRAYKSRTPERLVSRVKVYGSIAAVILLRSMDRSDYIYKAMLSRGFTGEFPEGNTNRFKPQDATAALLLVLLVIAAALLWQI